MPNTIFNTYPSLNLGSLSNVTIGSGSSSVYGIHNFTHPNMHPAVKKYEIYETPADILALSVAWKRMREAGTSTGRIGSLLDKDLHQELTSDDHRHAESIRDHYSKKVLIWKLMGDKLSAYREDLNSFVHGDGMKFRENMLGLAYHLPSFYEYDTQLDEVRLQVVSTRVPTKALRDTRTLKPLKRIVFKNKRMSNVQYWMQDSETDTAAMIQIETKNPLEHLWNRIFEASPTIEVEGNFNLKKRDNFEYVSINQWKLT